MCIYGTDMYMHVKISKQNEYREELGEGRQREIL